MARPPSMKRRRLARELLRLRNEAGLTHDQVAKVTGFSSAKVSRVESAIIGISSDDTRALCELYNVDHELAEHLVVLARAANRRGWWVGHDVAHHIGLYLELESDAVEMRAWTIDLVPGLMQTEDYGRAVVRARNPRAEAEVVEERVKLRVQRQERRLQDLVVWAVMSEAVLVQRVGGSPVMREQLLRLLTLAELPNITIQVLPFAIGEHSGMGAPFHLFDLGKTGPPTAHVDYHTGSVFAEEPDEVRQYATTFEHLTAAALDPRNSMQRIIRAAEEMAS